ncbi:tetratricopeptide repeat protein, partial [Saccharothrix algeriensis]
AFPVASMDPADATRMLDARIGDRSTYQRRAVQDLVALCRGLPLAIDIVAHRIATSPGAPLAEFFEQLSDERRLLALGDHGDGGDGSLKTVFSWSYRALRRADRRVFRLLGLHPGPDISIDTATALLGVPRAAALDCLDLLVAAHLVEQPGSLRRYRFHDLLHDYAQECAVSDEPEEQRRAAEVRLIDFFLHTAKEADAVAFPYRPGVPVPPPVEGVVPLQFGHDREAQGWVIGERANLVAVLDLAARRGLHAHVSRLAHVLGDMFRRCGYYDEARFALVMAIGSAQVEGDLDGEGAAYNDLGLMHLRQSAFFEARKCFHLAHGIAQQLGEPRGLASSLHNLARVEVAEGRVDRGVQLYEQVLCIARGSSPMEPEAATWHRLGVLARERRNRVDAAAHLHRALELRVAMNNTTGQADTLVELGELHREQGELHVAEQYVRRAVELHRGTGVREVVARACARLALIRRDRGDVVTATLHARQAVRLYDRIGDSLGKAGALTLLGELRWRARAFAAAEEGWEQAFKIFSDAGDPRAPGLADRLALLGGDRAVPAARSVRWSPDPSDSTGRRGPA